MSKPPLQLLVDECVYQATTDFLRHLGHDLLTAQELGLSGADDATVIDRAVALNRVFLTRDKDFSSILLYPPAKYLGIVMLKIHPETMSAVHRVLEQSLSQIHDFTGKLVVVDRNKFRVRHLESA